MQVGARQPLVGQVDVALAGLVAGAVAHVGEEDDDLVARGVLLDRGDAQLGQGALELGALGRAGAVGEVLVDEAALGVEHRQEGRLVGDAIEQAGVLGGVVVGVVEAGDPGVDRGVDPHDQGVGPHRPARGRGGGERGGEQASQRGGSHSKPPGQGFSSR